MANTYTQLYIHYIFAVQYRENFIGPARKEDVNRYVTGLVKNLKNKLLAVDCQPDHLHMFVGQRPTLSVSDFAREVKSNSSRWINEQRWTGRRFHWQEGFAAFTHSRSQLDAVVKYILSQDEHHKSKTFRDEYLGFLKSYEVEYNDQYVFEFYT